MLIVMGPVVGVPATDLFAAAVIPGLLLSGLYIVYALVRSYLNPALGPALPMEERAASFGIVVKELLIGIAPIVVVILATLGVILAGIATPTDAGAVGAFAVLILTLMYRRMSWQGFQKAVYSTLEVSCMILLLVAASNYFGAVFSRLGSANLIAESLLQLSFSPTIMLLLILGIIFVLGWPLEWVPIVLIVVPILLPLVTKLGINLVWFCTLVAVCLQTAWLSPPVALSAYFLKGVVPDWPLKDIYSGMMQFMVLQMHRPAARIILPAARALVAGAHAQLNQERAMAASNRRVGIIGMGFGRRFTCRPSPPRAGRWQRCAAETRERRARRRTPQAIADIHTDPMELIRRDDIAAVGIVTPPGLTRSTRDRRAAGRKTRVVREAVRPRCDAGGCHARRLPKAAAGQRWSATSSGIRRNGLTSRSFSPRATSGASSFAPSSSSSTGT